MYIRETRKTPARALADLHASIRDHGFGVLHEYDFQRLLAERGHAVADACTVLEICQPALASTALREDMRVNLALPCRMSVFVDDGRTWIGMIPPGDMLALVPGGSGHEELAHTVEQTTRLIIDDAL